MPNEAKAQAEKQTPEQKQEPVGLTDEERKTLAGFTAMLVSKPPEERRAMLNALEGMAFHATLTAERDAA